MWGEFCGSGKNDASFVGGVSEKCGSGKNDASFVGSEK